jgi:hypothetical protein
MSNPLCTLEACVPSASHSQCFAFPVLHVPSALLSNLVDRLPDGAALGAHSSRMQSGDVVRINGHTLVGAALGTHSSRMQSEDVIQKTLSAFVSNAQVRLV